MAGGGGFGGMMWDGLYAMDIPQIVDSIPTVIGDVNQETRLNFFIADKEMMELVCSGG